MVLRFFYFKEPGNCRGRLRFADGDWYGCVGLFEREKARAGQRDNLAVEGTGYRQIALRIARTRSPMSCFFGRSAGSRTVGGTALALPVYHTSCSVQQQRSTNYC